MEIEEVYEIIRSGAPCKAVYKGIPAGHGSGEKELSADEGIQELQEILEFGKPGGTVSFNDYDQQNPSKPRVTDLFLPL